MKYIIEHLEPELFEWCIIEYTNISKMVGKENLIFTNIKKQDTSKLINIGKVYEQKLESLKEFKNMCILDPDAKELLTINDKSKFEYLVFGGILGDFPPKKRTKEELTIKCERRHIGEGQFPTDNAVAVCQNIINGIPYEKQEFVECLDIDFGNGESVQFPFKYLVKDGKPLISDELIHYLKEKEDF